MKIQSILLNQKRLIVLLLLVFTFLVASTASINLATQQTSFIAITTDSKTANDTEKPEITEQIEGKIPRPKELSQSLNQIN